MNDFPSILAAAAASTSLAREWDSPAVILLQLTIIVGLVLLNGFFVASEFAIVKVRTSQLDSLEDQNSARARFARHVTGHLDAYLSATQLGITLASLGLGWVGEPFLARMLEPAFFRMGVTSEALIHSVSFAFAFGTITFLHIVLGELAPKSLAITKSVETTLAIAQPLGFFYNIFKPAIWFLNGSANLILREVFKIKPVSEHELAHSEEELRVILAASAKSSDVTNLGKEILINALDMRRRVVRDITTPRKEVVFLNVEDTFEENLERAEKSRHTRFPLCVGHLDNTIGLVHMKDLIRLVRSEKPDLQSIKRDLLPVPEMMSLEKLLAFFLNKHAHIALVVDEYGGAVGIVTLDNVLEELVGEIQDEFDVATPEFKLLGADEFTVEGRLGLYELKDLAGLDLESEDVSTVGGYITHLLGHLPKVGDSVKVEEFDVTVTKADDRSVHQLHFRRTPREAAPEEEESVPTHEER